MAEAMTDTLRHRGPDGHAVFADADRAGSGLLNFGVDDLDRVLDLATGALRPGGTLLAVHWLHPVAGYPRSGEDVHRELAVRPGLGRLAEHRERDFLAEVFIRADGEPASVAQAAGLA